jgi:hypothetical protein
METTTTAAHGEVKVEAESNVEFEVDEDEVDEDEIDEGDYDSDDNGYVPFSEEEKAKHAAMREIIYGCYNEMKEGKVGKWIETFREKKLTIYDTTKSQCPPWCGCVSSTCLFDRMTNHWDEQDFTPEMYDFAIKEGIIEANDMKVIQSIVSNIRWDTQLRLAQHVLEVSDIKTLVEHRDKEYGDSILHSLLRSHLSLDDDWTLGIFKKFHENKFDMKYQTHVMMNEAPYDSLPATSERPGQSLLDLAIFSTLPQVIMFLLGIGCRFDGGEFCDYSGIHQVARYKHSFETVGALPLQALIQETFGKRIRSVKDKKSDREDKRDTMWRKCVNWRSLTHAEIQEEIKKENEEDDKFEEQRVKYRERVYETVKICVKNDVLPFKLDLKDKYGYTLREYVIAYVHDEPEYFSRFMDLLK